MVLSTGTLNLKFMQRAAARQAQSTPSSSPAAPSTDQSSSVRTVPGAPMPGPSRKKELSAVEQEALGERWVLPRHSVKGKERELGGVTFERSYMGFIGPSSGAGSRSGGGRMTFGFGDEKAEGEGGAEGEGEDEDEDDEHRAALDEIMDDRPHAPRTFIMPRGFDAEKVDHKNPLPAHSTHPALKGPVGSHDSPRQTDPWNQGQSRPGKGSKRKRGGPNDETEFASSSRLHATPSVPQQATAPNMDYTAPLAAPQDSGKAALGVTVGAKRARPQPSKNRKQGDQNSPHPINTSDENARQSKLVPSHTAGVTPNKAGTDVAKGFKGPENGALDKRERAIKAQKKKEKKARKNARASAGAEGEGK